MTWLLTHAGAFAAGIAAVIAVLKLVAPKTSTKLDDDVLAALEKAQPYVTADELAKLKAALGL